ncbi:hypothetical protein [Spirosoma endophyticum]|uniref:Phage portal protein n=1 Tax=Spirosoma endophyticum TaxID=662367 RepID=A0A1I1SKK5_9BACT|nr:hypothetical protein [Spirosoma endophyticum]SFD47009.1 hypothetical protein SAMN05216167_105142 [Spirosoma endophyticum]
MTKIRKLGTNVYALQSGKNGAVVTFGNADTSFSSGKGGGSGGRGEHVQWGDKDLQLGNMHKLASESPNKWRLVKTRRDFVVGRGVYTHADEKAGQGSDTLFEVKKFKSFEQWRILSDWDRVWIRQNLQYAFSGNVFLKMILEAGKKNVTYEVIDAFKMRVRKPAANETKITAYIFNANFGTKAYKPADSTVIPAFDPADPTKFPVCILHLRDDLPGQDFYSFADWWSTETWTRVANKIPIFHDSGLDNGYNIKYHISVADDYFDRDDQTQEEKEALQSEVLRKMGETLAGIENTDKALVTFHKVDINGKEIAGIKITPITNKMSDDAYTTLFNTANVAQASGHGVLPSLAGIDTGGKLGGSGKELESAANYQQNFLTYVDRFILLTPLRIAKIINGWEEEMDFDVRNIQLYNYDVTPKNSGANPNSSDNENADK